MDEIKLLLAVIAVNAGVLGVVFLISYVLNRSVRKSGR